MKRIEVLLWPSRCLGSGGDHLVKVVSPKFLHCKVTLFLFVIISHLWEDTLKRCKGPVSLQIFHCWFFHKSTMTIMSAKWWFFFSNFIIPYTLSWHSTIMKNTSSIPLMYFTCLFYSVGYNPLLSLFILNLYYPIYDLSWLLCFLDI